MSKPKKAGSPGNIKPPKSVNITEEDRQEADRLEGDAEFMLNFVDLIFGFDRGHLPPS